MILSTIRLLVSLSPLVSVASKRRRINGASVGSVVNAQIVTESVASNRSSWTMTAGLSFPAYAGPPETVQISPRFNPRRHSRHR